MYSYDKLNEYYLTQIFKRYYGMNINIFEGNPLSQKTFSIWIRNKLLSKNQFQEFIMNLMSLSLN